MRRRPDSGRPQDSDEGSSATALIRRPLRFLIVAMRSQMLKIARRTPPGRRVKDYPGILTYHNLACLYSLLGEPDRLLNSWNGFFSSAAIRPNCT